MIGKKVGRWTIIGETRKKGKKYYACSCECGTVKAVYYRSLEKGESNSCGCLRRELQRENLMGEDMTGRVFGRPTTVGRDASRRGYWICECECGNRKSIRGTSLTKKKEPTRSCGCIHTEVASVVGSKTIKDNSREVLLQNAMYKTNFHIIGSERLPKNNTSGHKGVKWDSSRKKWRAYIDVQGKSLYLGRYDKKEDAILAREEAEEMYFKPLLKEIGR